MLEWAAKPSVALLCLIPKEGRKDSSILKVMEEKIKNLPVMRLNCNVTDFLSAINTIDIRTAIQKGLKNEIIFAEDYDGKPVNALCTEDGQVYLSPNFAQAVWNMCYAGLKLADHTLSTEECISEGSTLDSVYKSILESGCSLPECLYIKGVVEAMDWEPMLDMAKAFRRKWAIKKDFETLNAIDICGAFESRVNGMYMCGMGGILLHEITYFFNDHYERKTFESRRDLEQEADDVAFEALMAQSPAYRRTGVLGCLCAYLLAFFTNKDLIENEAYYREDVRLFRQFDKVKDEDCKRRANVIVAYVLSQWLKEEHEKEIAVEHNREEKAVELIREELKMV